MAEYGAYQQQWNPHGLYPQQSGVPQPIYQPQQQINFPQPGQAEQTYPQYNRPDAPMCNCKPPQPCALKKSGPNAKNPNAEYWTCAQPEREKECKKFAFRDAALDKKRQANFEEGAKKARQATQVAVMEKLEAMEATLNVICQTLGVNPNQPPPQSVQGSELMTDQ